MPKISPIVTADVALFTVQQETLRVLLLQRDNNPQAGAWALPGALLKPEVDLSLEHTARKALAAKTRVEIPHLEQVSVFSGLNRDPRGYSIGVLFYALLPADKAPAVAGAKAKNVAWSDVSHLKRPIAFDHRRMIDSAAVWLRQRVERLVLPLHLLPEKFTLTQLQRVCEIVLEKRLDKGSFRRRLRSEETLVEVAGEFERGANRPAQLFRAIPGFRFDIDSE
jgi:ADP-ribose pyrophosphatase YjhB (NUDIX family)